MQYNFFINTYFSNIVKIGQEIRKQKTHINSCNIYFISKSAKRAINIFTTINTVYTSQKATCHWIKCCTHIAHVQEIFQNIMIILKITFLLWNAIFTSQIIYIQVNNIQTCVWVQDHIFLLRNRRVLLTWCKGILVNALLALRRQCVQTV